MTIPHKSKGDRSRDEVLAGEYVLGVLGSKERLNVEERLRGDRLFAAMVRRWEDNLLQLDTVDGAEVPSEMLLSKMEGLPWPPRRRRGPVAGIVFAFWSSLPFWRGIGLAALGTFALYLCLEAGADMRPGPGQPMALRSVGGDGAINLVAHYDDVSGRLQVTPAVVGGGGKKSLQLWLVGEKEEPRSLGVLPQTGESEIVVPPELRNRLLEGASLAFSAEPLGGSSSGKASGPVMALGLAHP
ncbi:anti-sigma factor domain-containing protein [Rhizobium cremeum]|uniref:anti-sigma factor n=1 Tax=Rhizobium cremeum TaxID=2813827 RepID=UPI000DE54D40